MTKSVKRVEIGVERKCDFCHLSYVPDRYNRFYCSREHKAPCYICGKEINFTKEKRKLGGDRHCCSKECVNEKRNRTNLELYGSKSPVQNPEIKARVEKENLEKYGTKYAFHSQETREKQKQNNLKKYGKEHYFQTEEFKKNLKAKNQELYGTDYYLSTQECKDKRKATNLRVYGVENVFQAKEVKAKIRNTLLEKYEVTSPAKSPIIKEKIRNTNLKKYGETSPLKNKSYYERYVKNLKEKHGVINISQIPEVREKIISTVNEKYGVPHISKIPEIRKKAKNTMIERYGTSISSHINYKNKEDFYNIKCFIENNSSIYSLHDLMLYFDCSYYTIRNLILLNNLEKHIKGFNDTLSKNERDFIFKLLENDLEQGKDFHLHNRTVLEGKENERDFIFKLLENDLEQGKDFHLHNRTVLEGKEIDLFFPEHNIAVEISPMWTHRFIENDEVYGKHEKEYHYNKFKMCKEKGIELITVFDWIDLDKIINFIKSKSQRVETVYARKTKVNTVDSLTKEHKEFIDKNHILGKINNSKTIEVIELVYNEELVGLGVFEKKNKYVELRRLTFSSKYRVQGGASKIMKTYLKNNPEVKEIITFSDNDLGTGNVYKTLGFEVIEENKGTLIWYNEKYDKRVKNLSLVRQGADRLLKNFPGYSHVGQGENLPTNQEIIASYGFLPIYDCGYTKWKYKVE